MQRLFANISKKCYSSHKKSEKVKYEYGFKYRHSKDLQRSGRKIRTLFLSGSTKEDQWFEILKSDETRTSQSYSHSPFTQSNSRVTFILNQFAVIFFKEIFKIIGFSLISARNWIWSKRIWRWNFQNLGNFYVTSYEIIAS